MSGPRVTDRVPSVVWVAPVVPSLVLASVHVFGQLQGGGLPFSGMVLWLLWACTTLPLVLLALGIRSLSRYLRGDELEHHMAVTANAVGWAEGLVERARLILDEADALLRKRIEAAKEEGAVAAAPAPERRAVPWLPVVLLSIVLAFSGVVGFAFLTAPEPVEDVHLHAAFAVFVEGERVNFTDPAFDLQNSGFLRAHMHNPDQDSMHIEGAPGLTLSEFFWLSLGSELHQGRLRLNVPVHDGVVYEDSENMTLRVFVAPNGSHNWARLPHIDGYVMRDHDRILVTYGNAEGDALLAELSAVATTFP